MSSRELQTNFDPNDDPFYGLGYTVDEEATKLYTEQAQYSGQAYCTPVRPFKRSGHVRSTESDRDMIPEQQPTAGELVDRQRGFAMIDQHTRERIDHLEASYEGVHPNDHLRAAKIVKEIARQQKWREDHGLDEYSSLTIDD